MIFTSVLQLKWNQVPAIAFWMPINRPAEMILFCFCYFCSDGDIKHDSYLVPFTMYELGLLHKQKGDVNKAIAVMENAM